ncbi:terminase large subunit [Dyadobacter sp. CY345]|uniref:terminase large subunit n=1 Tax=Dyadobacter sp. CY345 TaxID=2909335 RepID=UPI001F292A7F|nr:terminase TerL endonuclease subunit [Dyadobacter sp. CY345]MCF2443643.1 terminase large subunit [Dyadobacter sp. CY345]
MLNPLQKAYDYAADVRSGKKVVGGYVKLSVERFYKDLENATEKGFVFNEKAAQKALSFFEMLCFTKGKWMGKPFELQPWQCFIVANVFGWKVESTGLRRFTEAYVEIPKKCGKTELAAGIGLYMLMMDGEKGADVYAAAYTRDQANICFKGAKTMASKSPSIKSRLKVLAHNLYYPKLEGGMSAVSHDADNTEGKHAHCVVFDEYHVHKTDDVKTSLRSGMAARDQPLFFIITTAGSNKQGPCYKYRKGCIDTLKGYQKQDRVFSIIYSLDEGDDWENPTMWEKANPNYGVSVRPDFLQGEYEGAKSNGRAEVEFKTKHLNLWVDSDVTWIPSKTWDLLAKPDFKPPRESVCYGGIDLGQKSDISAFALYFPEYKFLRVKYYVAEEAAEYAARSGIDYKDWIENGFLCATPGKTTDYEYMIDEVAEACDEWSVNFIGMDSWGSQLFWDKLTDILGTHYTLTKKEDGTIKWEYQPRLQSFRQGFKSLSPPTNLFEELVINGNIVHDGNPVTGWMLGNVALDKDSNDNIKPNKAKSKDKIDGIIAAIMALAQSSEWNDLRKHTSEVHVY